MGHRLSDAEGLDEAAAPKRVPIVDPMWRSMIYGEWFSYLAWRPEPKVAAPATTSVVVPAWPAALLDSVADQSVEAVHGPCSTAHRAWDIPAIWSVSELSKACPVQTGSRPPLSMVVPSPWGGGKRFQ